MRKWGRANLCSSSPSRFAYRSATQAFKNIYRRLSVFIPAHIFFHPLPCATAGRVSADGHGVGQAELAHLTVEQGQDFLAGHFAAVGHEEMLFDLAGDDAGRAM